MHQSHYLYIYIYSKKNNNIIIDFDYDNGVIKKTKCSVILFYY